MCRAGQAQVDWGAASRRQALTRSQKCASSARSWSPSATPSSGIATRRCCNSVRLCFLWQVSASTDEVHDRWLLSTMSESANNNPPPASLYAHPDPLLRRLRLLGSHGEPLLDPASSSSEISEVVVLGLLFGAEAYNMRRDDLYAVSSQIRTVSDMLKRCILPLGRIRIMQTSASSIQVSIDVSTSSTRTDDPLQMHLRLVRHIT